MSTRTLSLFLLILLACIWGSSFILMKRGMETTDGVPIFSDSQVGALRMLIASLVLLPITVFSLKKLKSYKDFIYLTIVGTCGNFVPAFLFTYAETELSSGYAGMMNTFTSIFALVIGVVIFRQKLLLNQVVGILIAFSGMVFLMYAGQQLDSAGTWKHLAAIIFATFLYGISLNTIKHRLSHLKSLEITSLAFGILLLPGIVASIFSGSFEVMESNPHALEGLGYIAILSIVGTALALLIFNRVIGMTSTLFASSVTYLIPIVAVFIGMLYGERINMMQVGAMLVVLFGVFLANSKFSK